MEVTANQWPIVYSEDYNIGFMGLEKLHPFDSGKWGKVFQYLKGMNKEECLLKLSKYEISLLHLFDL